MENRKKMLLVICVLMDLGGMLTYLVPGIAEIFDVAWAPFSSFVFYLLFRGSLGAAGSAINFIEEITPGLDFIPTFTIAWVYKYVVNAKKANTVIPINPNPGN